MPKQAPVSLLMLVTSSLYLWVLPPRALGPVCLSAFINMTYSGWSIFSPCLLSELHSASSILSSMRPAVLAATGSSAVVTVCPFPGVDHLFAHQLPQLIYGKAGVEFKRWFPSLHLFHQPVPCSPQEWLLDRVIGDNAWHTAGARYILWSMSDQTGSTPISSPIFCVFLGPSGLLPAPAKVCFWTNCWGSIRDEAPPGRLDTGLAVRKPGLSGRKMKMLVMNSTSGDSVCGGAFASTHWGGAIHQGPEDGFCPLAILPSCWHHLAVSPNSHFLWKSQMDPSQNQKSYFFFLSERRHLISMTFLA